MSKYIIKESQLRSVIKQIIAEELSASLNEGFWSTAGKVAKTAAIGAVAPTYLLQKGIQKAGGVINGKESLFGKVGSGSPSGSSRKQSRAEAKRNRAQALRDVSYEYGAPETIPGSIRKDRLAPKRNMTIPGNIPEDARVNWGDFGVHYHDEGDRKWTAKLTSFGRSINRNARNDNERDRLIARYTARLERWLKRRDRVYREFIKNQRGNI